MNNNNMKLLLNSVFIIFLLHAPPSDSHLSYSLQPFLIWFYIWVIKLIPSLTLLTLLSYSKTLIVLCLPQYKIRSSQSFKLPTFSICPQMFWFCAFVLLVFASCFHLFRFYLFLKFKAGFCSQFFLVSLNCREPFF